MLKIWGRANSINVQKVLWCCGELGLPYHRIDAGNEFGVTKTPQYRGLNPNSLVPTIEDGDFSFGNRTSSCAISRIKADVDASIRRTSELGSTRNAGWTGRPPSFGLPCVHCLSS
jgi:hypothetical protein